MSKKHDNSINAKADAHTKNTHKSKDNNKSSGTHNYTSISNYRHDIEELTLFNDQLYACYTGILSYLFLIKATQESIDKIEIKYEGGDVDNLPDPARDANMSTILSFYALLQFTLIGYKRFTQVSNEYAEGLTDVDPRFRQQILYGLIISVANMIDQRMRELNSPYSPILTPFPV